MRLRGREISADVRRTEAAPYPSSVAKAKAHQTIERLVDRGRPNVDALIEHDGELARPQADTMLPLVAVVARDSGSIIGDARGPTQDTVALACWLHKAAMMKAVDA